jgi:sporulation protein YlmC with PRC-barrel domain
MTSSRSRAGTFIGRRLNNQVITEKELMKVIAVLLISGLTLAYSAALRARVAGSTLLAVSVTETREVADGWSAKRQILGHTVFNDTGEKIGAVEDIIFAPDEAVSYAIIGARGFLGAARHNVAVQVNRLQIDGGELVLPGATKETLKRAPEFEYAR